MPKSFGAEMVCLTEQEFSFEEWKELQKIWWYWKC